MASCSQLLLPPPQRVLVPLLQQLQCCSTCFTWSRLRSLAPPLQAKNRLSLATHAAQKQLGQPAAEAAAGDAAEEDESMEGSEGEEEGAEGAAENTQARQVLGVAVLCMLPA